MAPWKIVLVLVVAGAIGGLINGFLAEEGFAFSRIETMPDGKRILRPGVLGNVLVGAVTAIVLTGLYSPLGSIDLWPAADPAHDGSQKTPEHTALTLYMIAGPLLSGIGGARLLTNELDKRIQGATREKLKSAIERLPPDA